MALALLLGTCCPGSRAGGPQQRLRVEVAELAPA